MPETTEKQEEDIMNKEWVGGQDLYRDPDYVEGSHPMDTGEVTWHHQWQLPKTAPTSDKLSEGQDGKRSSP